MNTNLIKYFGVPPAEQIRNENRYAYTAASGQTNFSAEYTVGYVDVYYNGSHLDPTTAFTASDGHTIILTTPASVGDSVVIVSRPLVALSSVYTQGQINALLNSFYGVATGTGDAMVVSTNPTFSAFVDGMEIRVRTPAANTLGNPTIACNGLSAKTIIRDGQVSLTGGDYSANDEVTLRYIAAVDKLVLMTGKLTAVTPPQFDNTPKLATTAFVKSNGLSFSITPTISASRNLTAADIGAKLIFNATCTLTIPTPVSLGARPGDAVVIACYGGNTGTVAFSGSTYVYDTAGKASSITVKAGESLTLIAESTSSWRVGPSTAGMGVIGSFASFVSSSGYQKLPSGLILQWGGGISDTNGLLTVNYPVAFASQAYSYSFSTAAQNGLVRPLSSTATQLSMEVRLSTTGALLNGASVAWIAVGQ